MKLCVAGSRNWTDYEFIEDELNNWLFTHGIGLIISGTASGADSWGECYAAKHNIPVKRMPADWKKYGKKAGYIRNVEMAKLADEVIVFWDGKSKGTQNMIDICKRLGKPITVLEE